MGIRQMHIDFQELYQKALGNDYTHLQAEAIDDYLNMVIQDIVRVKVNDVEAKEGQSNINTERYYEGLENLIRSHKITMLPQYQFNNQGVVANLNSIGRIGGDRYIANGTLQSGASYRILNYKTGDNFTNVGGVNENGFTFTATGETAYQPTTLGTNYVVRDGNSNYITGSYNFKAGTSYRIMQSSITFAGADIPPNGVTVDGFTYINGANHTGDLVIGTDSTFTINANLTPITWNNCSVLESINEGEEFYKFISSSSVVNYSNGSVPVTDIVKNRIYKTKDVDAYLKSARGTVLSSPISHMEGGNLIVYHNTGDTRVPDYEKFNISSVIVKYYKKPNRVSLSQNIDCDLNPLIHSEIVHKAVLLATASVAGNNYQALQNNSMENKTD